MPSKIVDSAESDKTVNRVIVPLKKKRLENMYIPIAVEKALIQVCHANQATTSDVVTMENLSLLSEISVFHAFLNKIAQACDNMKGGTSICSVTVKQSPEGPVFLLTFNCLKPEQGKEGVEFLKNLLSLVGKNPENLKPKPLQKRVLWRILRHHVGRVEHYLAGLAEAVKGCIDHCLRHGDADDSETVQDLRKLKARVEFPYDFWTSDATKDKFLSDCETLIKAIVTIKNTALEKLIQSNSKQGHVNESSSWYDLRHFMGRFHSYRQAAEVITGAAKRWPSLYDNCDIVLIPSSEPTARPLRGLNKSGAEAMKLVLADHDIDIFEDDIARFEDMGLYKAIEGQLSNKNLKPYVHCEVLLHSYLLESGLTRESDFFNGWKAIGTSKPICRLCHYYFTNHPDKIKVRNGHANLYTSWRLVDVYEDQGAGAAKSRDKMISRIIQSVKQDVIKMLQDRFARRKAHDSNTYTTIPGQFAVHSDSGSDSGDDSDIGSRMAGLSIGQSSGTTKKAPPNPVTDSDSEGGGSIDAKGKGKKVD